MIYSLGGFLNLGPDANDLAAYQWNPTFQCANASIDDTACEAGGQTTNSWAGGSSIVLGASSSPAYYFGSVDATKAYMTNLVEGSENVTQAVRDIFWLKPDAVFVYDRGTSIEDTFKRFWLDLTAVPTVSGNKATVTTSHQAMYVTALLPAGANLIATTIHPAKPDDTPVVAELMTDAGTAKDLRMLHVIEAKDSGPQSATMLVQSSSGTSFEGAVVGSTTVLFKKTLSDAFSTMSYTATGATEHYITGLAANTAYSVSKDGNQSSVTTDSAGVLTFSSGAGSPVTVAK